MKSSVRNCTQIHHRFPLLSDFWLFQHQTCLVAIDGPSGAGKSNHRQASRRATRLTYIDTGAMVPLGRAPGPPPGRRPRRHAPCRAARHRVAHRSLAWTHPLTGRGRHRRHNALPKSPTRVADRGHPRLLAPWVASSREMGERSERGQGGATSAPSSSPNADLKFPSPWTPTPQSASRRRYVASNSQGIPSLTEPSPSIMRERYPPRQSTSLHPLRRPHPPGPGP